MELQLLNKHGVPDVPDWYTEAQCAGTSSEIFFPDGRGESVRYAKMVSIAKSICAVCPVIASCLQHALETNEPDGVWGGKTRRERQRLRVRSRGAE